MNLSQGMLEKIKERISSMNRKEESDAASTPESVNSV